MAKQAGGSSGAAARAAGSRDLSTFCRAPDVNLYLFPNGEVRACCRNSRPYGRVGEESLAEIWSGVQRRALVDRLRAGDASLGCEGCALEVRIEGRVASYPATFDSVPDPLPGTDVPTRIEFNLSNVCNLQCVQCNGDLSSSIRLHREGRPLDPSPYDDAFFDDLRRLIPHLRWAQFAGGEPFLAPENFRVWDLIAELNPSLECVVVTNATQWNDLIAEVATRLNMGFVFSLDGVNALTYEAIRLGADMERVLANVERFRELAHRRGTVTAVNHCLMPQNYREFGDVLLYAEERSMPVEVSVVRDPVHCSLAALPPDDLRAVVDHLRGDEARVLPHLRLNAAVWSEELDRLESWARLGPADRSAAAEAWVTTQVTLDRRIGGFPRRGDPTDPDAVAAELAARSRDGEVRWMSIDVDDRVVAASESLCALVGTTRDELLGTDATRVQELALLAFGDMTSFDVEEASDDRISATARFERAEVAVVMMPVRSARRWADTVRIMLVPVDPAGTSAV